MAHDPSGDRKVLHSKRRLRVLLGVLALALLTVLAYLWLFRETRKAADVRLSQEIFGLLGVKTPRLPIEQPGAVAWLDQQIRLGTGDPKNLESPGRRLPRDFQPIQTCLEEAARELDVKIFGADRDVGISFDLERDLEFRVQAAVDVDIEGRPGGRKMAMTRLKRLHVQDDMKPRPGPFLEWAAPYLAIAGGRLLEVENGTLRLGTESLEASEGILTTYRIARVYALSEDGSLISFPFHSLYSDGQGVPETDQGLLEKESAELRGRRLLPRLLADGFYFRSSFAELRDPHSERRTQLFFDEVWNSGFYLDTGGHGLVTTLVIPVIDQRSGQRGQPADLRMVIGVDIALELEWDEIAKKIEPQTVVRVELETPQGKRDSRPIWEVLQALKPDDDNESLREILETLSEEGEQVEGPLYYQAVGNESIALFQVGLRGDREQWLVVFFPQLKSNSILISGLLTVVILSLGFLAAVAVKNVQSDEEVRNLSNLLSTMRTPLATVDADDVTVFGNEAARKLGIRRGKRILDLIPEGAARDHYEAMHGLTHVGAGVEERQSGDGKAPRAYGLYLMLKGENGDDETRYTVIRSVSVTRRIRSLKADKGHRLAILFLMKPEEDLKLFIAEKEREYRAAERERLEGERYRLASLNRHGTDAICRALVCRLAVSQQHSEPVDPQSVWLAAYLGRRLRVIETLLSHWGDREMPAEGRSETIEASYVRDLLRALEGIFELAAGDEDLRDKLKWRNCVISKPSSGAGIFDLKTRWPENLTLASPLLDGVGFFLEEVLVNAVKHGEPGTRPRVTIRTVRSRNTKMLRFRIENQARRATDSGLKPYGGRALLVRLAELLDWETPKFERQGEDFKVFTVTWQAPLSEHRVGWAEGESPGVTS